MNSDKWQDRIDASTPAYIKKKPIWDELPMENLVFTCIFNGHYPVGACAIIVAPSATAAACMLEEHLTKMGLKQSIGSSDMVLVDTKVSQVQVILDGNY